jgi:hypothetical protein
VNSPTVRGREDLAADRVQSVTRVSGDIYSTVVRHGYDQTDDGAFRRLMSKQIASTQCVGWIRQH